MHANLYTFLVPRQYNDGSPVGDTVRERIESWFLAFGGGFSRRDQDGNAWRNNDTGQVYRDERVSEYSVLVSSEGGYTPDRLAKGTAKEIAGLLDQDTVLWYRTRAYGGFEEST